MQESITYNPDNWIIIKISSEDYGVVYKVLATWSGSYMWGSSWKISSGILSVEDKNDHWVLPQCSGSVYNLKKNNERVTLDSSSVLHRFQRDAEESNGKFSVKRITFDEFIKEFEELDRTVIQ